MPTESHSRNDASTTSHNMSARQVISKDHGALEGLLALRAMTISGALIYVFALQIAYRDLVSPRYQYMGLSYRDVDPTSYGLIVALVVVLASVLPIKLVHTSDYLQWILFVLAAAPCMLVSQYSTTLSVQEATETGIAVAGCTALIRVGSAIRVQGLLPKRNEFGTTNWLAALLSLSAVIYVMMLVTTGIQLRFLSFADVYSVRDDFASSTGALPLLGYLIPLQANVLNPLFIARGIYYRQRWLYMLGVGGQVLIYSSSGAKSVLFSVVAITAIALLARKRGVLTSSRLIVSTAIGLVSLILYDQVSGSGALTTLLIRRFFIIPGWLTAAYVRVFDDRPKMNFSEVLPSVDSVYNTRPSYIVGSEVIGDAGTNANVSWLGHGFLNAGYSGMVIESVVVIILFWLADEATKDLPVRVGAMIFLMPGMSLASASVFTTVLTHSFAAAIVVAWWLPRERQPQDGMKDPPEPARNPNRST